MTLLDVMVAIVVVLLLAVLLLSSTSRPRVRATRINCVSNLKQVGLAFRMWSNEHGDQMPMAVSTNSGGSKEFNGEVVYHFLAISNELSSPKVLICAEDKQATRTTNLAALTSRNVSYFLGLDADESKLQMVLSGDRNITNGLPLTNHIMQFPGTNAVGWTKAIHNKQGNIGLADGSAAQVTTSLLQRQLADPSNATNRLAIP